MRLPKNPFHPGEMLIEEFLVPGTMTQAALAKHWVSLQATFDLDKAMRRRKIS